MTNEEALDFLNAHQPLPDDAREELLQRLRTVTSHLFQHPDPACIPLLLNTLARWDDWSLYDSIQSVLRQFKPAEVVPFLRAGLDHKRDVTRSWSADTARYFPHPLLVEPLGRMLGEPRSEMRLVAAAALEMIALPEVVALAKQALDTEEDEDVLEILRQIVASSHGS